MIYINHNQLVKRIIRYRGYGVKYPLQGINNIQSFKVYFSNYQYENLSIVNIELISC